LDKSIQEASFIPIRYQRRDEVIEQPWEEILGPAASDRESHGGGESILEAFMNVDRALLILGEPGSGKTLTMIGLAKDLIQRAEADPTEPIPVILNLVSWSERRLALDQWVSKELTARYQIPRKSGLDWLRRDELILLLDGFDEAPEKIRPHCIKVINEFRKEQGLTGIVVCSRTEEYLAAGDPLKVGSAISLLPLNETQIDLYMDTAGSRLSTLHAALKQNATLKELARTPLMLNILGKAYSFSQEDLSTVLGQPSGSRRSPMSYWYRQLFKKYVKNMFERRSQQTKYLPKETVYWLSWLARRMFDHNQAAFLVEQMQPNWLHNGRWRWVYMLSTGLLAGIVGGIIVWLFLQILRESNPLLPAPVSNLVSNFLQITQGRAEAVTLIAANIILGLVVSVMQGSYFEGLRRKQIEIESHGWRYRRHIIQLGLIVGLLTIAFVALYGRTLMALAWGEVL